MRYTFSCEGVNPSVCIWESARPTAAMLTLFADALVPQQQQQQHTVLSFMEMKVASRCLVIHALSAWPLPEAPSPRMVPWHVRLPPPCKEEQRCPWGKRKHLVLARPVHISAGPHELAGDTCTEENRRPRRWPTSFLPRRPCRPEPRNTDEYVLGSERTLVKGTKTDLHPSEIEALKKNSFSFSTDV